MPLYEALPLIWAGTAITVVSGTLWRGWWRPAAFRDSPSRTIGLGASDLLIAFGLLILGMIAGGTVMAPFKEAPLPIQMLAMIAGQLLAQGLPAGFLIVRARQHDLGLKRIGVWPTEIKRDLGVGGIGTLVALAVVPGVIVIVSIVGVLLGFDPPDEMAHELLAKLRDSDSRLAIGLICLSAVILAPILEELVYRGLIQSSIAELFIGQRWTAIVITAAIFMSVHTGGVAWQALPALGILGIILGWVYERTGSLLPAIIIHMAFNAANISYVLFLTPAPGSPAPGTPG